jgi:hypothetical protein
VMRWNEWMVVGSCLVGSLIVSLCKRVKEEKRKIDVENMII